MTQLTTAEEKIQSVSERIMRSKSRISAVLPDGVSFNQFYTAFITMCRKTPEVWKCEPESIFDAAIDSAIDGLPCDGKHAAIVARNVNVGTKNARRYVNLATYTPMAFGIRKKLVETGAVLSIETTIVYQNEHCVITGGTSPNIDHEIMVGGDRGPWIGVYSVAVLPNGQPVFEYMSKEDVMHVKESAMTDAIWKAHETEMARKTVLRRHAKQLPGSQMMVDLEEKRLLSMIERKYDAQPSISAPKPTRENQGALEDQSNSMAFTDFGTGGGQTIEHVEAGQRDGEADLPKKEASGSQKKQSQVKQVTENDDVDQDIPSSASEFDLWAADLVQKIENSPSIEGVNELRRLNAAISAAAPEDVREEVEAAFVSRLADLA